MSNRVAVRYNPRRALVGDTDNGKALKEIPGAETAFGCLQKKGVIKGEK